MKNVLSIAPVLMLTAVLTTPASAILDDQERKSARKLAVIDALTTNFDALKAETDIDWNGVSIFTAETTNQAASIIADDYVALIKTEGGVDLIDHVYDNLLAEQRVSDSTFVEQLEAFVENGNFDVTAMDTDELAGMLRHAGVYRMINRTVGQRTTTTSTPASTSSPHVGNNNGVGQQDGMRAAE